MWIHGWKHSRAQNPVFLGIVAPEVAEVGSLFPRFWVRFGKVVNKKYTGLYHIQHCNMLGRGWFVDSMIRWFIASLMHWFAESLPSPNANGAACLEDAMKSNGSSFRLPKTQMILWPQETSRNLCLYSLKKNTHVCLPFCYIVFSREGRKPWLRLCSFVPGQQTFAFSRTSRACCWADRWPMFAASSWIPYGNPGWYAYQSV